MESEFFCSHLYDLSFFYHFHPFRVHFSDECFFIYPSSPLFPPVVLYQTPIITAEDPYVFPERSILEDQKKKKASVPGPSDTEIAPDCVQQAEDLALKNAAVFFGSALLKYLGISQSVSAVMPTEMVRLEVRHMYEDFNFQTADGAWLHFEFESDALSLADLKRFREYEATTSRTHEVAVTTCVLCSAGQSSVKNSFHEGINTYRVKLIRLKRKNADPIFRRLQEKQKKGEHLTQEDLFPLLLSPLMSGKLTLAERFLEGFQLLKAGEKDIGHECLARMQALLYVFAGKFLNKDDLKKVKGVISMTILGEMLVKDGLDQGIRQGEEKLGRLIQLLIQNSRSDEISRAVTDRQYQEALYQEFGL